MLLGILEPNAEQVTALHYHAKAYKLPYASIVRDAGCFIDPFFSSGPSRCDRCALGGDDHCS